MLVAEFVAGGLRRPGPAALDPGVDHLALPRRGDAADAQQDLDGDSVDQGDEFLGRGVSFECGRHLVLVLGPADQHGQAVAPLVVTQTHHPRHFGVVA